MEQIFGYIERITFENPENGFVVARLKQPKKKDLTTIVGVMPGITAGENLRLHGLWKVNSSHGLQFEVKQYHVELPCDVHGIQKYLESGTLKGIGPAFAKKIVSRFKEETLKIIDQSPEKLSEIDGIGDKRIEKIKTSWQEQKELRDIFLYLHKYQISPAMARRIYRKYKTETVEVIQNNPYSLARDIRGIGFKTADLIAEKLEFPKDSESRLDAGVEYVLLEMADEGHSCYPIDKLLEKSAEILDSDATGRIESLVKEERIVQENDRVWLKGLWLCEVGISRELKRLKNSPCKLREIDASKALEWVQKELKIELADKQKQAVKISLQQKLHIITGGPGTGKSTITKAILAITKKLTSKIILAAPTGRAAKRLCEITKCPAATIHSLLQYDFKEKGFRRNRQYPLNCDLLVIDESSMIDTSLMYHLLRAIPDETRLLIVGDVYQLPSVGPGNVLKDLIESSQIAVTELTEIFRQAAGSKIITNAHKINQGVFPDLKPEKYGDFFFLKANEPEVLLEKLIDLIVKRLPKSYHFDPIEHIQVLAPMRKGIIGIDNLNHVLQQQLNPKEDAICFSGKRFCLDDKVMQIRNNYDKEVFNGDIGRIKKIDKEEQEILVSFDGKEVPYTLHELEDLVLAYATSIHKFQGSECPCVVIPIHTSHFMMLHRNLLYTAVTRGKRLVVLVGSGKAIAIAVSNDNIKKRYSGLNEKIIFELS